MKGFTLLELLVVIAIIALIIVFVMPNMRNLRDEQTLNSVVLEIQSNIRTAQSNALSGTKCTGGDRSAKEWRFTIESSYRYLIEANCDSDGTSPTKAYILIPRGVQITSVNGCSIPIDSYPYIAFGNVTGTVTLSPPAACPSSTSFEMILSMPNNPSVASKTISVDSGGRIYAN